MMIMYPEKPRIFAFYLKAILFKPGATSTFCSIYIHAARTNKNRWVYVVRPVAGKEIRSRVPVKIVGRAKRKIEASAGLRKAQLRPATVARALKSLKKREMGFFASLACLMRRWLSLSLGNHLLLVSWPRSASAELKIIFIRGKEGKYPRHLQRHHPFSLFIFSPLIFCFTYIFPAAIHRGRTLATLFSICPRQIINFWPQERVAEPVYLLPSRILISFSSDKVSIRENR